MRTPTARLLKFAQLPLLCTGLALAAPVAASAANEPTPTVSATADAAKPPAPVDRGDEVLCRRIEVTGSHMGRDRVCKTRRDWEKDEQADSDEIDRIQRTINSHPNNLPH